MRNTIKGLLAVVLITAVVGCSDNYEKVAADMVSCMNQINIALKGVNDKSSAESAATRIRSISVTMTSVRDRLNKLGKPTKEQGDLLNSKYSADITRIAKEIETERLRIAQLGTDVSRAVNEAVAETMRR